MSVPAYHIGVLKGYLSGQNAPAEIFVAAEALYMAAIQGPLRADAIEAINLVAKAAEKLMACNKQALTPPVAFESPVEEAKPIATTDDAKQSDFVLPELTRRALEMASRKDSEAVLLPVAESDDTKIDDFIQGKGITRCPPLGAVGGDHEAIAGMEQPKKRKEWLLEARAKAAERMRARQAAGLMVRRKPEPVTPGEAQAPSQGGA